MKKLFVVAMLALAAHTSFAQDDAFKTDVLKLIQMNGSDAQMKMAKAQILKMIAPEKQAAFIVEFDATLPSLYDKIAKVYMETYSKEDVKAMLAFYDTPIGKKMQLKSGEIMEKSQTAAQEWGQGLQGMMMKYLQ